MTNKRKGRGISPKTAMAYDLIASGLSNVQACRQAGISRSTTTRNTELYAAAVEKGQKAIADALAGLSDAEES